MAGYLPINDAEFSDWVDRFVAYAEPHAEQLGFGVTDLEALYAAHPLWDTALTAHMTAQAAAKAARNTKDENRAKMDSIIRGLVARIQAFPGTTDADRQALGITVKGPATSGISLGPSEEKPLAIIDVSARLMHVLRVQNVTSTGTKKAKPSGALGCEVWRKVGENPSGTSDLEYVGLVTRNPYVVNYEDADAGKTAHYMLRWVNSRGEKSRWSETESATIAA